MAINPATSVVISGVLVTAGEWSSDQPVSMRIVVGGTVLAIGLSVMNEAAPKLASQFGLLVLLAAAFTYGPAIAWKVGLLDHTKYKSAPKWV